MVSTRSVIEFPSSCSSSIIRPFGQSSGLGSGAPRSVRVSVCRRLRPKKVDVLKDARTIPPIGLAFGLARFIVGIFSSSAPYAKDRSLKEVKTWVTVDLALSGAATFSVGVGLLNLITFARANV